MTAESTTWNIERVWTATTEDTTDQLRTLELSRFRGLIMLGTAGSGKTTEAARLANQERASGASVQECRLAEFADTSTELAEHLRSLSEGADEKTVFYLDALDEAMIPARRRWLAIKRWVTDHLGDTAASIRITCRSAVWPSELTRVIADFAGNQASATALLHPLSDDDILSVAASHHINPVAFLDRIRISGARSLAGQPLLLRMLLQLHQSRHGLPASQKDLFQKGLELLLSDPEDRHEIGTQNPVSPTRLLQAAERLACYMILGGRETVRLRGEPLPNQLSLQDVSDKIAREEADGIRLSGLSDSSSPADFRFGHRQFAEYLAGRRLARLPTHQAKAFLAGPDGWNSGVAGPLRETAAFAAMFNADIADWIATRDPELIGLSDVADSSLRRAATRALLDRFRRGEMTTAQLRSGVLEFQGLRYHEADADLRPVLRARGDGCDDLLECAIDLARTWKLFSLSDDLADLVLDSAAPMPIRAAAGYALRECGHQSARQRLKPLIAGLPEDQEDELKGVALRCNWPDHLSTPDLLHALTARRRPSLYGAYEGFLLELERDEFAAAGHLPAGLRWAKAQASDLRDSDVMHRIAIRIAQAALHQLDDPAVSSELITLLRDWARHYMTPLAWLPQDPLEPRPNAERENRAPLRTHPNARRRLIDLLMAALETRKEIWELAHLTPGMANVGDFQWLLSRSCEEKHPMVVRQNYLQLAWLLPWETNSENVDAWLLVCDGEPVKSILGNQRSVELASDEAQELRTAWMNALPPHRPEAPPLDPPPRDRIQRTLHLAETDDIRHFRRLCSDLTLEPTSTRYESAQRFLTRTPGWRDADSETRARTVELAKAYLCADVVASEASKGVSPNSFHVDVLGAIWLLLERDPDWVTSRGQSWWSSWCWYILRELIPNLAGERSELKRQLLRLLNENSPASVCQEIVALARGRDSEFGELLPDLLPWLLAESNRELDKELVAALREGTIAERNVAAVSEFVLARAPRLSVPVCLDILNGALAGMNDAVVEHVAVSLLRKRPAETWDSMKTFLRLAEQRGRRVLGRFAHEREAGLAESLSTRQLGELAGLLIELFSPETDTDHEGAHVVTADDSVRTMRSQLISYLGSLEDADAVAALRELERRFGTRYPWLRRPRSEAERALRLSRWSPFSVDVIADVLGAQARRLIRSEDDVIDGIEFALEQYAVALIGDGAASPEDLWNTATGAIPTPKAEEHVSGKLCGAVRSYFLEYSIAADREVEIHRRTVSTARGGEPGSEVDILVQVPGRGTTSGDVIRVPVEVKLSCNDAVKTGIRTQLADRYMPQLGASHGVYVVVWMSLPQPDGLREGHRPRWPSMELAQEDLLQEAERLSRERGIRLRPVVVDGSLR